MESDTVIDRNVYMNNRKPKASSPLNDQSQKKLRDELDGSLTTVVEVHTAAITAATSADKSDDATDQPANGICSDGANHTRESQVNSSVPADR
jgi:hypothetical protein